MGCTGSKFQGDGQRLGSIDSSRGNTNAPVTRPPPSRAPMATSTTGGSRTAAPATSGDQDRRAAAAAAAERRLQDNSRRGTANTNPNQGSLARELDKQKKGQYKPEDQLPERVVWD
ncbi:hypothetical protein FRB91_011553 [Serendipita sp. 411]|nr:hypothetical protein FRB91_011553 [Serendipita sp. 411]